MCLTSVTTYVSCAQNLRTDQRYIIKEGYFIFSLPNSTTVLHNFMRKLGGTRKYITTRFCGHETTSCSCRQMKM